ncbi:MAG: hypothetical protein IJ393_02450 [Clostridia bacterium]|nr:hypothetical protein [Clostridia bacterium]
MAGSEIIDKYEPAACFDLISKGRGRPRKKINATGMKVIEALSRVMCTEEEIAACLDITVETLHNEVNEPIFLECIKKGRDQGKMSLRRSQFELAKVNATMAIWLGKQYLGQKEHPEEGESKGSVSVVLNFRDTSGKKGGESE